jgi:hypothetical protein
MTPALLEATKELKNEKDMQIAELQNRIDAGQKI